MSKLVWLHLSDIHFLPTNEWQDSTARTALIKFLSEQLAHHQLKVDLIFCTGDIAFGALSNQSLGQQYAMARQFFDQVLALCGCDKSRLFVVPGNHDINRGSISKAEHKAWADWCTIDAAKMVDEIPEGFAKFDGNTKDAMGRLLEWGEFVADYLPHQKPAAPGHHHYAQTINIRGRKIGIAGFNSAWTCAGNEDDRRLWLAAGPQFDHMRAQLHEADVKIGLIHHPLDWFNVQERSTIKQRIAMDAHFWLHGHTHDAWVEPFPGHVTLGAGAIGAHSQDEFGCNLVQLDFDSGRGRAHLFRYKKAQARWLEANDIVPTGGSIWAFALPGGVIKVTTIPDTRPDSESRQRRLDAAAPRHARLGSTIDVIVQMRMLSSPLLGKAQFPSQVKPDEIVLDSRQVDLTHGLAEQRGQLLPAKVKVRLIAPLFNIPGAAEQLLDVPAAKYSEPLVFMLVPTRTGECRIDIELLTVDDVHIKTIPLSTAIDADEALAEYETASLVVNVSAELGSDTALPQLTAALDILPQEAKQAIAKMPIRSRALLVGLLLSLIAGAGAVGLQWQNFVAMITALESPPVVRPRKVPKARPAELMTVPLKVPNIVIHAPAIKLPKVVIAAPPEAASEVAMASVVGDNQLHSRNNQTVQIGEAITVSSATSVAAPVVIVTPAASKKLDSAGAMFQDTLVDGSKGPEMVMLPAGSFEIGSEERDNGKNVPQVTITKPFAMGKTEVTVKQYLACVTAGKCPEPEWREKGSKYHYQTGSYPFSYSRLGNALTDDNSPVVGISWRAANAYVDWLNENKRTQAGQYSLPSDVMWKYAARAGSTAKWSYVDDLVPLEKFAWYAANSGGKPHQVGTLMPNAFGLYDMHGNALEWSQICYDDRFTNPTKDSIISDNDCKKYRRLTLLGGSWNDHSDGLRLSHDTYLWFFLRFAGFRVAWILP